MVNKDDFDKLDADKDGVISEKEFEKAKDILSDEKGIEKEKLNWFLRLITLGDRFSFKDLMDRAKQAFVQFIVVFFGVLISFGVEQKGDDFEDMTAVVHFSSSTTLSGVNSKRIHCTASGCSIFCSVFSSFVASTILVTV